jgi:hypothetical protein
MNLHSGYIANTNWDLFEAWVSGTYWLGAKMWASSNTGSGFVGTGVSSGETEIFRGRLVNKYPITLSNGVASTIVAARQANLVGGFRIGSVAGTTDDTRQKRHVWSLYTPAARILARTDETPNWAYVAGTAPGYRVAGNNPENKVSVFNGNAGAIVMLDALAQGNGSTSGYASLFTGIGINSATVDASYNSGIKVGGVGNNSASGHCMAKLMYAPTVPGHNEYYWLEARDPTLDITWYGYVLNALRCGLYGSVVQ